MRFLLFILTTITLAPPLFAAPEPFMVGPKVEADLERALARVIPAEQFLVQVNTDVAINTQRKLVEGETVTSGLKEDQKSTKEFMPGFLPESEPNKPLPSEQNRQIYRLVDSPELKTIRVHISFDDSLPPATIFRAKNLVQSYLTTSYPNLGVVTFSTLPMLKPPKSEKEIAAEERNAAEDKERKAAEALEKKTEKERLKKLAERTPLSFLNDYAPWIVGGLALLIVYLLSTRHRNQALPAPTEAKRRRRPTSERNDERDYGRDGEQTPLPQRMVQALSKLGPRPEREVEEADDSVFTGTRKRFLQNILSRSDAFRMYFERLSLAEREEVYAGLRGPAFDNFLDGMGIKVNRAEVMVPPDIDEKLNHHEKSFLEFCDAKNWQDKQFFGFLHRLSDEQLMSVINDEAPAAVGVMLRFMKAHQSAFVLDKLQPQQRVEILTHATGLNQRPFSEILSVEKEVRTIVDRMPGQLFSSNKEDVDYWGAVLSESVDQDQILEDLEKTQPGIYPELKKFRFKLDDVPSISPAVVKKVLAEADNEELGLALMSCDQKVTEFILGVVTPRRREMLEDSWDSFRGAEKNRIVEARVALTKKFREAIA